MFLQCAFLLYADDAQAYQHYLAPNDVDGVRGMTLATSAQDAWLSSTPTGLNPTKALGAILHRELNCNYQLRSFPKLSPDHLLPLGPTTATLAHAFIKARHD